jgi:hypothetical protein
MEPQYSRRYISEFLRVLAPGGLVVFQVPDAPGLCGASPSAVVARLAPSACQARIVVSEKQLGLSPGEPFSVRATVENAGDAPWPATGDRSGTGVVQLGNHWRDCSGRMRQVDDGRTPLPGALEPGQRADLVLLIRAPSLPGRYELELDMVQEHVGWFGDRGGSPTHRLPVRVRGWHLWANALVRRLAYGPPPEMEMHGLPHDEVIALIRKAGGRLLAAEPDFSAPAWVSFRYWTTKE